MNGKLVLRGVLVGTLLAIAACGGSTDDEPTGAARQPVTTGPEVNAAVRFDVSPPLHALAHGNKVQAGKGHPAKHVVPGDSARQGPHPHDPVQQSSPPTAAAPTVLGSFDGVGNGFTGPSGTYAVHLAPPDTNGDVGPNHYVHMVNNDFAVFNKSGTVVFGPVQTNTVFSGFGGGCQTNNDGDGTVLYDPIADRWIISQFSVSTTPYLVCVAVSRTGDPTGAYNRYAFSYANFPDYPKLGVWQDAYYVTVNQFNSSGTAFLGARVCAWNRAAMLAGTAATQQCFNVSTTYPSLLPADLDGSRLPPAGAPEHFVSLGTGGSSLAFWNFHVDWTTPANSTFTGPTTLTTAAYALGCSGGTRIPQSGTNNQLDSLGDRVMHRLAYRNFGDHEALVVNHSITAGSSVGVRWYELRLPGGVPSVFQQGTYAPDAAFRWMGSIAQDKNGGIALGFSSSSATQHPGVRYTGRLASDPVGLMTQGEGSLIEGAGSQTGGLDRWGDYSAIAVDPTDDCTFWYTNEYIPANGSFNWKTRVGSFRLPGCNSTVTNDFSITANPSTVSGAQGSAPTTTISTSLISGTAQTVALSASGLPTGTTASFSPASITTGASSTLTFAVGAATVPGSYSVTVTGTGASATHTTTVGLTVTGPAGSSPIVNGTFETGNLAGWTPAGTTSVSTTSHSGSYAAMVGGSTPTIGDSSITQTFTVPATGGTLSFWYRMSCPDSVTYDWATATLRDNVTGTTTTLLPRTCTTSSAFTQVTSSLAANAGHSVTLTLVSHDDNYATDPSYTLYDDVEILGSSPPPPPSGTVQNPGFETGAFSPWTTTGTSAIVTTSHSGSYAARLGSSSPTNGDSTLSQTFTIPTGATRLSLWYNLYCPDAVRYDWATVTLTDNVTKTTVTMLPRTCNTAASWVQISTSVTTMVGHSVTLRMVNHDDNYPGDATYTLFDDVAVQ